MQYPRILFFINGAVPSLAEQLEADKLMPCRVCFRNAQFASDTGALEGCDGWYGEATPISYRLQYEHADDAISAFNRKRIEIHKAKELAAKSARQKSISRTNQEAKAAVKQKQEELIKKQGEVEKAKAAAEKAQQAKLEHDNNS